MKWDSHLFTKDAELKVNQRLQNLRSPSGELLNLFVKNDDIVIFQRTLELNEADNTHSFVVILKEDLYNQRHNRPCYGEFILNNHQVEKL